MKIVVLFFTCNRPEYFIPMFESFHENVEFDNEDEVQKIWVDDYPTNRDEELFLEIKKKYNIDHLELNSKNLGYSASWKRGWELVEDDVDYIYHQEEDFVYESKVNIKDLIRVFENSNTPLNQITLKRQQWYSDNSDFIYKIENGQVGVEKEIVGGVWVVLHQYYFNSNPCLYPRWVLNEEYPHNPQESVIIDVLRRKYPNRYCAIYGKRKDPFVIKHIGDYNQGKKVLEGEPGWDWLKGYNPDKKYWSKYFMKEYST